MPAPLHLMDGPDEVHLRSVARRRWQRLVHHARTTAGGAAHPLNSGVESPPLRAGWGCARG